MDRELPDLRRVVLTVHPEEPEFGHTCSSFFKLIRVRAWVNRFVQRAKKRATPNGHLTISELRMAKASLLQDSQAYVYGEEMKILKRGRELPVSNPLSAFSPYIDQAGFLRVGGRLQKSDLKHSVIHPIILSVKSRIVQLMVRHTHQMLRHAGPSTVMSTLASSYHIPRLKALLRKISRICVPCRRIYAKSSRQLMGELPASRVHPVRPFSIVGLDFAGPLLTKRGHPRKPTLVKAYVCVFICFATRAVHFEVVSDLSTPAFLAALTRFVSRRGMPSDVHSDNGKNFVGAEAELQRVVQHLNTTDAQEKLSNWVSQRGIHWHFTPARAPHFGGLWEAAVRSMKTVLTD